MFVPRQIQKKVLTTGKPAPKPTSSTPSASKPAPTPATAQTTKKPKPEIDHTVAKELILALEQLLGSINPHTPWLKERHREVEGQNDYIHLMSIVECDYFEHNRPQLSQILVRKALNNAPSEFLQISADGYHVRFKDPAAIQKLEDTHTIYVEPAIAGVTQRPGQVARQFTQKLPPHLCPVRYVQSGGKSWALISLSAEITDADTANAEIMPDGWMVLTKSEWRRRDAEYVAYRNKCVKERFEARQAERAQHQEEHHEYAEEDQMDIDEPSFSSHIQEQQSYIKGLLVQVSNLHPKSNKSVIRSMLDRTCDRYARQQMTKDPEAKIPLKPEIQYIDYTKGLDTAYVRVKTPEDSKLIIDALEKRRRIMESETDIRGVKAEKDEKPVTWVSGKLLEGEVERRYWENIQAHKAPKGNQNKNKKKKETKPQAEGRKERDEGEVGSPQRQAKRQRLLSVGTDKRGEN